MRATPIYEVIKRDLAQQIAGGSLRAGEQLPSEAELAQHYGVSRMTLRQALAQLEADGLVLRKHGAGTFVRELPARRRCGNELGAFHEELGRASDEIETLVLAQEVGIPPRAVARQLRLSGTQRGLRIQRLRSLDGEPISLQESWLPYLLAPSLARNGLVAGSLYRTLLEREHIEIAHAEQQISATLIAEQHAEHLRVPIGTPALEILRISYSTAGDPFEVAHSVTLPNVPLEFHLEK